jgi:RND family efflux transporter MFP subunit
VLAEVDGRQARDAALQAKAAMAGAQAALVNATVTAERTSRLLEHGIAARQEVDDAQARLASARAAAAAAQSALDAADRNAAFATVRAPIAGVVLRTVRAPGDLLDGTPATPLLELGDPAFLNLLVSAVPRDLVELAVGQVGEARFEALPDKRYRVTVSTIAPMIDPLTGVGTVRLSFEGPTPPIGLAGEAHLAAGESEALVVPSSALRGGASGGSELLRCEEGKLVVTPVVLGARDGAKVQIRAGLTAGQRFVERDVLGLEDGQVLEERP